MGKANLSAGSLGNILEWLDFGLFIYLAPVLAKQFFPTDNIQTSYLEVLAVFAAGFICRPLGSILFGFLGDRYGRVVSLRLSILAITLTILFFGLLPSYEIWGFTATVLFVGLRLLQGLSVGGEYGSAMIYLAEAAPQPRRGYFTSFAAVGANVGFLLASIIAFILHTYVSKTLLDAWVWRVPFLLIALIGLSIFIFRLRLIETPVFKELKARKELVRWPLFVAILHAPRQLLKIVGLSCMGGVFYYVFFGNMPNYLEKSAGFSLSVGFALQSAFLLLMLLLVPMAGALGDRFGRKKLLGATALGIIIFAYPCFYLLQLHSVALLIIAFGIATLLSSFEQGNTLITVVENCPANIRTTGVSFAYNIGMALFGGTAPLIIALLTSKVSIHAPAYYLMAAAAVTLLVVFTIPETYRASLLKVTKP
ncbi:MAG: MFS transporter [Gammaproteobacteria bacterium]|nr:MFS transporter [Gammaproteobacteria bacterium]